MGNDAGQSLSLGTGVGSDDVAFYADDVIGALIDGTGITNIVGNGFDIFYDPYATANTYLGGRSYGLAGGGSLMPDEFAPEPGGLAVLLSGLTGLGVAVRRRRLTNCQGRPASR